jgi:hypothetical protein
MERIANHARWIVFLSNLTVRDGIEEQAYPVTRLHAKIERLVEVSGVRSVQAISCAGPIQSKRWTQKSKAR